jgi:hypothetical protein
VCASGQCTKQHDICTPLYEGLQPCLPLAQCSPNPAGGLGAPTWSHIHTVSHAYIRHASKPQPLPLAPGVFLVQCLMGGNVRLPLLSTILPPCMVGEEGRERKGGGGAASLPCRQQCPRWTHSPKQQGPRAVLRSQGTAPPEPGPTPHTHDSVWLPWTSHTCG